MVHPIWSKPLMWSAPLLLWLLLGGLITPHALAEPYWERIFASSDFALAHFLGNDAIGRDVYVRLLFAARVSALLGLSGALVAISIGMTVGLLAGYFGGRIDQLLMRTVDVLNGLPLLFLLLLLMALMGRSVALIVLAAGAVLWLDFARIVRAQTLKLRAQPYIEAAQMLGFSSLHILTRQIMPNLKRQALGYLAVLVPKVILLESFLSFLGLGVQEPYASLGAMISDGAIDMELRPTLLLAPVMVLMWLLLSVRQFSDSMARAQR